ncbi:hypothetical protein BE221DRAFT_188765 [Ostreococcus tauri]|uniref:M23ase beta-sheet core domain-containing protein n=1 Tax=Ostreococcus tauri TaxID=70448 RepID=A0A1Y5IMW7_OSTTA|nr:hypothetical protein BE221DRAFT_188765 [Ostreococcus tauri]
MPREAGVSASPSTMRPEPSGFVESAGDGCHICLDVARRKSSDWLLGSEAIDLDEYSDDIEFPDVAIDCEESESEPRISATNAQRGRDAESVRVAYVTVYDVQCVGRGGKVLKQGVTIDSRGTRSTVTTFVVLVPPRAMAHLCRLRLDRRDVREVRIDSDVRPWSMHPTPNDTHSRSVAFPLRGERFLCTQSEGGELTHFFSGNLHAVDFRCDEGTPVLAAGDGVVVDVRDSNTLTGIAVSNLFEWNSIVLRLDDADDSVSTRNAGAACSSTSNATDEKSVKYDVRGGDLFVEYVHIRAKSARVRKGDRVTRGQVICESGSVGFSPEPHLHFTAFRSSDDAAHTVRVLFQRNDGGELYLPRAGLAYNETVGECS